MSKKPRIAIPEPHSNREYTARVLPEYTSAIEAAGGEAVVISLGLSPAGLAQTMKSCDAVLLPGSHADIDPEKYGEQRDPHTAPSDVPRDNADELLLQDAFNMRKPVFGICYGIQSLNVWRTGKLIQHIESPVAHEKNREMRAHTIDIPVGTRLGWLAQEAEYETPEIWVNSSHHQSVAAIGDGLRVAAVSPKDGIIEAVESTSAGHWVLGVQWHPERTYKDDHFSRLLFRAFITRAQAWHERFVMNRNDFEAGR
jgi:putative glutamine amidotransferase